MLLVPLVDIQVLPRRQRTEMDSAKVIDLANSISSLGLIHPVVVRTEGKQVILVAGERRVRAMEVLWGMGDSFSHGGRPIPEGQVPCTLLKNLDPLDAMEIELEENIRREDLSWQDRAKAESELYELRRLQAEKQGIPPPTPVEFAQEVHPEVHRATAISTTRQHLILARHLDDPEVAAASSPKEGMKVLARKEEASRNAARAELVGRTFSASDHTLLLGDCLTHLSESEAKFDCILSDPPYGINAQDFNDSGGKADATGHSYDDSLEHWDTLLSLFLPISFRVCKPQAHLYLFCDSDQFLRLRGLVVSAGWKPFRTPLIWHNPSSQRAPWPQHGPHRKYQMCLYATKGDRPALRLASDLVEYRSDDNLGWAAQKPVALYTDFLSRTCRAGDSVCDPFAGSGTIFPAAHGLKVRATGIELDSVAYGIAVKRLQELK